MGLDFDEFKEWCFIQAISSIVNILLTMELIYGKTNFMVTFCIMMINQVVLFFTRPRYSFIELREALLGLCLSIILSLCGLIMALDPKYGKFGVYCGAILSSSTFVCHFMIHVQVAEKFKKEKAEEIERFVKQQEEFAKERKEREEESREFHSKIREIRKRIRRDPKCFSGVDAQEAFDHIKATYPEMKPKIIVEGEMVNMVYDPHRILIYKDSENKVDEITS